MSWRLEKKFRFEAAHYLPKHDGKCKRLHGHSWVGTVVVEGESLESTGPKSGMLMDFSDLKALVDPLVDGYLDHHYLNDSLAPFEITNPTSEVIALWMFNQIDLRLQELQKVRGMSAPIRLASVRIEETCTSAAEYRCESPSRRSG